MRTTRGSTIAALAFLTGTLSGCGADSTTLADPPDDGGTSSVDPAPLPVEVPESCEDRLSHLECGGMVGVCATATPRCVDDVPTCVYREPREPVERTCDGLDNDCDGDVDESCTCAEGATQRCGSDAGSCVAGTQRCEGGTWGTCESAVGPREETCNGLDDDCDGAIDDGIGARECALRLGVCAGSEQTCEGASGWVECGPAVYGPDYEPDERACDGLDNDCDGSVDEGCDCLDGAVERCGTDVGRCARGTRTCAEGRWSGCVGEVTAETESCDWTDEDCDGAVDEGLPAGACDGRDRLAADCLGASSGPFAADEDGATRTDLCDGVDNDCDGIVDEGCDAVPLIEGPHDLVAPALSGGLLVYLSDADGNRDVYAHHIGTGTTVRVTDTPEDEHAPTVGRRYVGYSRGAGSARRAYVYDLATGTEHALASRLSDDVVVDEWDTVMWAEHDGAQWDLFVGSPVEGTREHVHQPGGTPHDERAPSLFVDAMPYVSYLSNATGTWRAHWADWGENLIYGEGSDIPVLTVAPGTHLGTAGRCWTDGRNVAGPSGSELQDWDVWCTRAAPHFPDPAFVRDWVSGPGAQIVESHGTWTGYRDARHGNWDVGYIPHGASPVLISRDPADQRHVTSSAGRFVWQDARLGSWDLFTTTRRVAPAGHPIDTAPGVHSMDAGLTPHADLDGDGDVDAGDRYVELRFSGYVGNTSLDGIRVLVDGVERHVFGPGSVLEQEVVVIFAGAGPYSGTFGGAQVIGASTGSLAPSGADLPIVEVQYGAGAIASSRVIHTDGDSPGWD